MNPCYEDKESGQDEDEAVVHPSPLPQLVVEDLDADVEEGKVQP